MVVLVNGLPAAGKSTLAPPLASALELPQLSKDAIKETHADVLGSDPPPGRTQREWNRRLGTAASQTMWALLGVAEVWCEAPLDVLRSRFARRWASSHAVHGVEPDEDEWAQMVQHAEPLSLGPVLRLDTSVPVDLGSVVEWCRANAGAIGD